ncbi:hypothetical protein [Labrys wisconsinensis]|uniref:Uncharacterized protein n=1 Tax=Labrys wisconsinensis TaxID=425677 RepID=A0ABU0JHM6_9HYPH|nr:hypothetical protein [Labrys wisconsinensis]MDQ0472739.1 hypothetical protein [Labrys wisconsinensis]
MPLQNRVDPFGAILAIPERGGMMGNRGGRIHDATQRIGGRLWTSRRWICCELQYKGMWRPVMGAGYTELFFLDEVTALAAGHRPCFFCRRAEALAFARAFAEARGEPAPMGADTMDAILHAERLDGRAKRRHLRAAAGLPEGVVIEEGGAALARAGERWLAWSPGGWHPAEAPAGPEVSLLTPPAIVAAILAGYEPRWHASAR